MVYIERGKACAVPEASVVMGLGILFFAAVVVIAPEWVQQGAGDVAGLARGRVGPLAELIGAVAAARGGDVEAATRAPARAHAGSATVDPADVCSPVPASVGKRLKISAPIPAGVVPILDQLPYRIDQDGIGQRLSSMVDMQDYRRLLDIETYRNLYPLRVNRRREGNAHKDRFSVDHLGATVAGGAKLCAGGEIEVEAERLGAFDRSELV